jgi:cell pole-organizing protein PopZ
MQGRFEGHAMTQPARQEPSMEEILASIRRIIAEDEPATQNPPTEAASIEPLRAAAPPAMPAASTGPAMRDEDIDGKLAELRGMSRHVPRAEHAPAERSDAPGSGLARERPANDGLLSPATTAAVDAAFHALAQTAPPRGGRTVEELVSELLRPMLKAWLDDNLPAIVERLVRAEIERVSRARD